MFAEEKEAVMNEHLYILWLSMIEGLGNRKQAELLKVFGSAEAIFRATPEALRVVKGISEHNVNMICANRDQDRIIAYADGLAKRNIGFVGITNPDYPQQLKSIFDPPTVLFVSGTLPDPDLPCVSIIGSRHCTEYGKTVSHELAKYLAQHGVAVVSGMARGIDSMAHKGALEGGGITVAVLGCGVDVCYPPENKALRDRIRDNGCVISEYPPQTQPMPGFFPARNRIISGLSSAVIVTEAAKRSGTLITVSAALEQGRDVMAVPGNITSKLSGGTNELIKDGAIVLSEYADVLRLLGIDPEKTEERSVEKVSGMLAPEEKLLYDVVGFAPVSYDTILGRTNAQPNTVNYILTLLELKGLIRKLPGNRFIRTV